MLTTVGSLKTKLRSKLKKTQNADISNSGARPWLPSPGQGRVGQKRPTLGHGQQFTHETATFHKITQEAVNDPKSPTLPFQNPEFAKNVLKRNFHTQVASLVDWTQHLKKKQC